MAETKGLTLTVHMEPEDLVQQVLDELGYNGHTLREWIDILASGPIDGIWLCNPSKNSNCSKENCYKNGGCCYHTVYRQYAMFPMEENGKTQASKLEEGV